MKNNILQTIAFICMLLLSTGSVFLSCVTAAPEKRRTSDAIAVVNTGKDDEGKIFSGWVYQHISSVMLIDDSDRSRKIELSSEQWRYNQSTSELELHLHIPFNDYIVHMEGEPLHPQQCVLHGIATTMDDLLVILDGRLAIEDYDYRISESGDRVVFRDDIDLRKHDWFIRYATQTGAASMGEWKPDDRDRLAYIEAEHSRRVLDAWYDSQDEFWFFEAGDWPEEPPTIIRRAATKQELEAFKAWPMPVIKFRPDSSNKELSKELGFDASLPDRYSATKCIEEYAKNGKLVRTLCVRYDLASENHEGYGLEIVLSTGDPNSDAEESPEYVIDKAELDIGLRVERTRWWGMRMTSFEGEKPTVVRMTSWSWKDGTVYFSAMADESEEEACQKLISDIITFRKEVQ
jgi:hypothetical protein